MIKIKLQNEMARELYFKLQYKQNPIWVTLRSKLFKELYGDDGFYDRMRNYFEDFGFDMSKVSDSDIKKGLAKLGKDLKKVLNSTKSTRNRKNK